MTVDQAFKTDLFNGKTAIVTGGTSGIGEASSKYLAGLGAKVYAVGLGADQVTVPEGLSMEAVELDVTDREGINEFFSNLDSLDILANGAGIGLLGGEEHEISGYEKVISINLTAVMNMSIIARPLLKKNGGSIVNFSSMYATFGAADIPAYSSSKGAIDQLTKSLAEAYAPDQIRVNAVAPGWIDTPLLTPLKEDDKINERILSRTPMARYGDPAEVGQVIAFLCSPAASFVTGAIIPVDGGYLTTGI